MKLMVTEISRNRNFSLDEYFNKVEPFLIDITIDPQLILYIENSVNNCN